ncbi:MAG: ParB/RepB/Spo0J family partition protein [Sphingomonadaceae bacterium]
MSPPAAVPTPPVLPLALIDPSATQPRRQFDEVALAELADSIRIKGVLQPILVRPMEGGRYEIVAGERRWRASQLAGLHDIPVIIRELGEGDSFEAALIENVQRADLNPLEEAEGYQRLIREFGHTQESIASLTGKSRSHIANLLRILDLPENGRSLVKMGLLSLGHAKAVLAAKEPELLAREIAERGLTVRQAETAARKSHDTPHRRQAGDTSVRDADIEALELQMRDATGLAVSIAAKNNAGTVTLRFSDLDQLDMIVSRLGSGSF